MRILLIGHAYLAAENQKKVEALAQQPGVTVRLLVPQTWQDPPLYKNIKPAQPAKATFEMQALPVVWAGQEQYHWYLSADLGMREFKPDLVCVEQGAGSFVYAQSLIYRNLYAPKAKAVFFTWWNLPYQARWPLSAVEQFNLSQTQGAITGNQAAAGLIRAHGFEGPMTVLPQLGVDTDTYRRRDVTRLREELGLHKFTVGYSGRFVEEKGIRVLLEALTQVKFEFQLLMLGRGPLEDEIRAFAQAQGWQDRLKIVSGIGHSDMANYQNCMDVMVVPSLTRTFWMEQFGHVIIEALACEVPVIGSNSGEVPNVIGEAGLITPEGDVARLGEALERVAASPQVRAELGRAGRQRVLDLYTNKKLAEQWVGFFKTL